ncbi:hypothetical protein NPIL_308911 [Nephila pilipes]|uniref:Uncharacterized protein n=1 Tax=Nephila pilipes TaxID=299642 RepID=A0A8X6PHV9_NEPPI|nr:hypothetical protein NPIL_308911 [Nephila pilipes]
MAPARVGCRFKTMGPGWPLLEPGTHGVKRRAPGGPQSLLTSQGQRGRSLWDAISSRPSTLPGLGLPSFYKKAPTLDQDVPHKAQP